MDALRNSIKVTKQIFTPIRLNIIFLLVNILVGIAIKNTPLIVSSCIAFVCVVALSLRNPMKERIHRLSGQVMKPVASLPAGSNERNVRLSDQVMKPVASLPAGSNERNVRLSDQIVVASVMIAIFVMWFDTHHHIRTLSGLILLYAFGIFLIGKLNALYNSENKDTKGIRKWIYDALHYFGSFGHFLFNLEYALLVLI